MEEIKLDYEQFLSFFSSSHLMRKRYERQAGRRKKRGQSPLFLAFFISRLESHTKSFLCLVHFTLQAKKRKTTCSLNQNHLRKQLTITSVRVGDFLTRLKPCPIINLSMGTFIKERKSLKREVVSKSECLLTMWLRNDLNLAQMIFPFPLGVVVALQ